MLSRRFAGSVVSVVMGVTLSLSSIACGGETDSAPDEAAVTGDDANLTEASAAKLKVPLAILQASFYIKPTPMDQSGLGVMLAPGVAFADGATSQALPKITTLDRRDIARLPAGTVTVGEERYGAMFDFDGATSEAGERLMSRAAPPMLAAGDVKKDMTCRVLGTDMDMYASGPPKIMSLEGKVDRVRDGLVLVKTTQSTGGDMSLLVCDGKLAGVRAGAGSQGTWHEYHVLDKATLDAFTKKRDACTSSAGRCR